MRVRILLLSLILGVVACGGGNNSPAPSGAVIAAATAPPALPEYDQPPCPAEGHIWTPGYWGYDLHVADYYWVPGTWVAAPQPGLFWTPPYWAWNGAVFVFNEGWWGPQVGFYGGINYEFGYFGSGFEGGMWRGGQFFYNREVTNIDVTVIRNVYSKPVVNNYVTRVSYNGGEGGIVARPTAEEVQARKSLVRPTAEQTQHVEAARNDPQFRASTNHGKPQIAATAEPAKFSGEGVVKPREVEPVRPTERPAERPTSQQAPTPRPKTAPAIVEPAQGEPAQHVNNGPAHSEPQAPAKRQVTPPAASTAKSGTSNDKVTEKAKEDDAAKVAARPSPEVEKKK